jgi:hypothetical protein
MTLYDEYTKVFRRMCSIIFNGGGIIKTRRLKSSHHPITPLPLFGLKRTFVVKNGAGNGTGD